MAANVIDITVEDVNDQLEVYTQIQVESATSVSGSYSLIDTETLVADQFTYPVTDESGTINTWYRWRLYNPTGPVAGDYSAPFNVGGVTRRRIRESVLEDYRCGYVMVTSGAGSTTTVLTDDYRIKNTAWNDNRGEHSVVSILEGVDAGLSRYVLSTDVSAGQFTIDALPSAPGAGVAFEWNWISTQDALNKAINRALTRYKYIDRIPIAAVSNQPNNEYSLDNYGWLNNARDVGGLGYYPSTGSQIFRPWDGEGRWWNFRVDAGVVVVMVQPNPDTTVYLEGVRNMPALYDDDTVLPANASLDLCAALAYDELLNYLLQPGQGGTSEDYTAWNAGKRRHQSTLTPLIREFTPVFKGSKPRRESPFWSPLRPWRSR